MKKICVIHWWVKDRQIMELNEIERFHIACQSRFNINTIFDEIIISLAVDNLDNTNLIDFVKDKYTTQIRHSNIKFVIYKNNSSLGEYNTYKDYVIKNIGNDVELFYCHFKSSKYDSNHTRYKNSLYWAYLMYKYCLTNYNVNDFLMSGFYRCQNNFHFEKDDYNKFWKNDIINQYPILNDIIQQNNDSFYYNGTFHWINCKSICDYMKSKNIDIDRFKNINITNHNTHYCEYILGNIIPKHMAFSNDIIHKYEDECAMEYDKKKNDYRGAYLCYDNNFLKELGNINEFNDHITQINDEYIKNNFTIIVASYTQAELVKAFCRFYKNSGNDKLINLCIMHDDSWSKDDVEFCKSYGTTINAQDIYSNAIEIVKKIKGNDFKNNAVGFISKFKIIEKCPTRYAIWLDDDIELKKSIRPIIEDYINDDKWIGGVKYKNFVSELSNRNLIFQNALLIIDTYDERFKNLAKYSFEQNKLITDESIFSTYFAGKSHEMKDLFKPEYYAVSDLVNKNAITLARNNPDVVINYLNSANTIMSHWCGGFYGKSEVKKWFINKSLKIKDKHDVIVLYTNNGLHSKTMKYDRYEIEYVITSLNMFCNEWLRNIYFVGDEPPVEWIKKQVIYIECDNPFTHIKDANILYKIEKVIDSHSELTDDFLVVSDDQIVTKKSNWDDFVPRFEKDMGKSYDISISRYCKSLDDECSINWWNGLSKTLKNTNSTIRWQPHMWSQMNKNKFKEMCSEIDYKNDIGCVIFSLYYNYTNQKPVENFDHIFFRGKKTLELYNTVEKLPRHVGWNDKSYVLKDFRDLLDVVVGFKNQEQPKKSNETQYQTSKNIQYFGNIKEDDNYEKLVSLIKSGQLKKKSSGVWYEVESNNEFNSIESSMLDVISSIIEKQKEIEDRQKELNRLDKEQNVRICSIHKQQESIRTDKQKIDEDKKNLELSKHQLDEDKKRLDAIKQGIKLEKKSKREQLKEDIATGKLVKVKMGNGYVWKRVR